MRWAVALLALALSACGGPPVKRQQFVWQTSAPQAEAERQRLQCEYEAQAAIAGASTQRQRSVGGAIATGIALANQKDQLFRMCLAAKGWQQVAQ